ncbi:NEL-type E3 ubiquitin ligase domain-containing protein [Pseudomonas sp. RT6P73]
MSPRPPSRGTASVDIHLRPTPPSKELTSQPDTPRQIDSASPTAIRARNPMAAGRTPAGADLDAITPALSVTVSELTLAAAPASTPVQHSLEHYRITAAARLPDADAQGFRTFKGRRYADVSGGGIVLIGQDPETGLYRARLPSERTPSGPVLVHDPESKLWYPLDDFTPTTYSLSDTRLETFRTTLDFTGVEPGLDGLFRRDGKLYAVIRNCAFQVLHDLDASSPQTSVMRIVRSEDPVALDDNNIYVATRPGRSEPIVFNAQNGWIGTLLAGAGGMRQGERDLPFHRRMGDLLAAAANRLSNPQYRARKLFPSFGDEQIAAFIRSLGDDVAGGLSRRETEYTSLKRGLQDWTRTNDHPSASGSAQGWAERVALDIRRCWRRETGEKLKLPSGNGTLPALSADFSHVRNLDISSITWSATADTFLANFSGLESLKITGTTLGKFPDAVGGMNHLTSLNLRGNQIVLDEHGAARLSALNQLQNIDLAQNPLGRTPDFSAMPQLRTLVLHTTGIELWPGLQSTSPLQTLDLRFNRLREVPAQFLTSPADQSETSVRPHRVTMLDGNEFPPGYLDQLDVDLRLQRQEMPASIPDSHVPPPAPEIPSAERFLRLYPTKSIEDANGFISGLGDGAPTELLRLEQEFATLNDQLDAWSFSGGGARQQYVRADQIQINATTRDDRYTARNRILRCWRQETPQMHSAADGSPIGLELDLSGLTLPSLPDLDADFSHVGSLKLDNMNLSTSPEGFLTRYRHLRWLSMSNNRLRELPPALGEMHGLTRLDLSRNQILLSSETARTLSGRVTLRLLSLANNQIGISPDFSLITDLRTLDMSNTGIDNWPPGVGAQPLLDYVQLGNNQITTIPDSILAPPDEHLVRTARMTDGTNLHNNPLSDETVERVRVYGFRLAEAGLTEIGVPQGLVLSISGQLFNAPSRPRVDEPFQAWAAGLSQDQLAVRRTQWHMLREQHGADGLFSMLERLDRLEPLGAGRADLQRRVWEVIDSITENSPESESLRNELFDRAGEPACCDRAAFSFGNLEVRVMIFRARSQALDQTHGLQLSKLSRGLMRLHEVDKIASADIQRSEAVINDPQVPEIEKYAHRDRLKEEVEIRLAYRHGLKDRLQLPGQPERVVFTHMGKVTQAMLDTACEKVLALDNSPEEFQALVSRDFWQDYVTNKYRPQFEAQSRPYQERLDALHDSFVAEEITKAAYQAQTNDLQAQLGIEEATLIQSLTRQELAEHPLAGQAPDSNPDTDK